MTTLEYSGTSSAEQSDPIDLALADLDPGITRLRQVRPVTRDQILASGQALLEIDSQGFTAPERLAVASFVAQLNDQPQLTTHYRFALQQLDAQLSDQIDTLAHQARTVGPFGHYPAASRLSAENTEGLRWSAPDGLDPHLAAGLTHAHLLTVRPREADPAALAALAGAGWDADAVVTLSQLVSWLSLQTRVITGLRALAGSAPIPADASSPASQPSVAADSGQHDSEPAISIAPTEHSEVLTWHRAAASPPQFTRDELDWVAWVRPIERADLTEDQLWGLVEASRAENPYFRLLARDPQVLRARTLADKDIFYNTASGLPRAERELAAAATSRVNGCIYCASVHARFAAHYSKRPADVDRLLDQGITGQQDQRWSAIIDAAATLTATPPRLDAEQIDRLRDQGLDELAISDLIHATAFFNWANRLMLSLGEPDLGER